MFRVGWEFAGGAGWRYSRVEQSIVERIHTRKGHD